MIPLLCWNFESRACACSRFARSDFVCSSRKLADWRAGATRSSTETSMYACANALAAACAKIGSGAEKLRVMMLLPRGGSIERPRSRTSAK